MSTFAHLIGRCFSCQPDSFPWQAKFSLVTDRSGTVSSENLMISTSKQQWHCLWSQFSLLPFSLSWLMTPPSSLTTLLRMIEPAPIESLLRVFYDRIFRERTFSSTTYPIQPTPWNLSRPILPLSYHSVIYRLRNNKEQYMAELSTKNDISCCFVKVWSPTIST